MVSPLSKQQARQLVTLAALAPSGGNVQPWCFELGSEGELKCAHDPVRGENFLNLDYCASYLAVGAAVENIALGATRMGLSAEVELAAEGRAPHVASLRFAKASAEQAPDTLADYVTTRATNRHMGTPRPIPGAVLEGIQAQAELRGTRLQWCAPGSAREVVAEVVGGCERLRMCDAHMHKEMMDELRWTDAEALETGDGVDIRTLEVHAGQRWLIRRLQDFRLVRTIARLGAAKAFEQMGADFVRRASAIGMLTTPGTAATDYFRGGQALQRVWLAAHAEGLGFQPLAVVPYMFARLRRGSGYDEALRQSLEFYRERFDGVFEVGRGIAEIMLFRLIHAPKPSTRARRRPVDAVLQLSSP